MQQTQQEEQIRQAQNMQGTSRAGPLRTQPFGPEPTQTRSKTPWVLVALFGVVALVVGVLFLYPTVTTTDGEAIANDMMAAWNSGTTQDFSDIYAESVVLTTTDDAEPDAGLDDVIASATVAQAAGFQVERVGAYTETGQLIAFPASVTTDDAGSDELMVVLRYDDAGAIVEQHMHWQTP
jgi:hypothetical protein